MKLFDITLTEDSRDAILAQVETLLVEDTFHRIATVNPEFLVLAQNNPAFKQSLQDANLCVADGIGIVWAGWLQGKRVTRFPGTDLLHEVLALVERNGHTVYLAIKKEGLSSYEEIRTALLKLYPKLLVTGENLDSELLHSTFHIQHTDIVLCNFGAPKQEFLLESIRRNPGDVRLVMGVGGAFDFLTGKQTRAPRCLRTIGLEWLWRLILQPSRFKRIWNAVVVFPFLIISSWQKKQKRL